MTTVTTGGGCLLSKKCLALFRSVPLRYIRDPALSRLRRRIYINVIFLLTFQDCLDRAIFNIEWNCWFRIYTDGIIHAIYERYKCCLFTKQVEFTSVSNLRSKTRFGNTFDAVRSNIPIFRFRFVLKRGLAARISRIRTEIISLCLLRLLVDT